jgi:hypothetical protein
VADRGARRIALSEPAHAPPFELELHVGGGVIVRTKLYEEMLRAHSDPQIAAQAQAGGREAARKAGVLAARNAVARNLETPLQVVDGDSLWIIPVGRIQAMLFRDPTIIGERQPFGFSPDRLGGSGETTDD